MAKSNKIEKKLRIDSRTSERRMSLECVASVVQNQKLTANGLNKPKFFWKQSLRGFVDLSYIYS